MNHFGKQLVAALAVVLLTLSPAAAGSKFKNKDTAKNRQNNVFGTERNADSANATFGVNAAGDSTIRAKPKDMGEPVDWYDKVIITVNPNVKWPASSSSTSTTTTYDDATDTTTTSTTTTSTTSGESE